MKTLKFSDGDVLLDVLEQDGVDPPVVFVVGSHEEDLLLGSDDLDVEAFPLQVALDQLVRAGQRRSLGKVLLKNMIGLC